MCGESRRRLFPRDGPECKCLGRNDLDEALCAEAGRQIFECHADGPVNLVHADSLKRELRAAAGIYFRAGEHQKRSEGAETPGERRGMLIRRSNQEI